jgi:hypothetical protein
MLPPAHRFYRFGKHYRAGLQAPERVSNVRIQGSEVFDQRGEQCPGGQAAESVSGDEGCSVAATRERRPQLARQPVNLKHEGESGWPRTHLSRRPTARSPAAPSARHEPLAIGAAAACLMRWLGPGAPRKKNAWAADCPALPGRRGFAASSPSSLPLPGLLEFRKSRWRGHLRGRALNDS